MKQIVNEGLRLQTIRYWAGFVHARTAADVARVHAFQALVREHEDLSAVTDDQVTEAYGGRGWAPTPVCIECGARDDSNVLFGPDDVSLCKQCIAAAAALVSPPVEPAPAKSFFSRLLGA